MCHIVSKPFTNIQAALAKLHREIPNIIDHKVKNHVVPRRKGGLMLFTFHHEDTAEVGIRDDGVCYYSDGTRAWEIRQHLSNNSTALIVGYYCQDRGDLGI